MMSAESINVAPLALTLGTVAFVLAGGLPRGPAARAVEQARNALARTKIDAERVDELKRKSVELASATPNSGDEQLAHLRVARLLALEFSDALMRLDHSSVVLLQKLDLVLTAGTPSRRREFSAAVDVLRRGHTGLKLVVTATEFANLAAQMDREISDALDEMANIAVTESALFAAEAERKGLPLPNVDEVLGLLHTLHKQAGFCPDE